MVNNLQLLGRLGKKPALRQTKNGFNYCFLNLALDTFKKTESGEFEKGVEWVSVKVYGKVAENCEKYLDKGRQVYVEGRVSPYERENDDGSKNYGVDLVANKVHFIGANADATPAKSDDGYQLPKSDASFDFGSTDVPF